MRKVYFLLLIILATVAQTHAQRNMRFGYIDMEYILENVDEYQEASAQLENRVQRWKVELDNHKEEIEGMRLDLSNERTLLTHELIEEREEEIQVKEDALSTLQQKRFGSKGDYYTQRRRLVQPIQDQVYTIVQELAEARKYDFIFDKTSNAAMLFAAERHDISDLILRRIDRSSNRRQATNKDEEKEIEKRESLTDEQDKELTEREKEREEKLSDRQKQIEERTRVRDSTRAAKQAEFEDRRQRILDERQRKRDSIVNSRKPKPTNKSVEEETDEKDSLSNEQEEEATETKEQSEEQQQTDRQKAIEERTRVRDSTRAAKQAEAEERRERVLEERQRRRDSIINARKESNN